MQGKMGAEGKHEYLTLIKIYETLSGKFYVRKGKAGGGGKKACLPYYIRWIIYNISTISLAIALHCVLS